MPVPRGTQGTPGLRRQPGDPAAEYPGARHAFLTLPGVEPQAETARAEILAFLRAALAK